MKKIATFLLGISSLVCNAQTKDLVPPNRDCVVDTSQAVKISQAQVEAFFQHNPQFRMEAIDYVPLKIHINEEEFGQKADFEKLMNDLTNLNKLFAPINIQFYICGDIDYHSTGFINSTRNIPNAINIYLGNNPEGGYCGFATLAPSTNTGGFIFIQNFCLGGNTLAHEIGHYFSLHHPHDTYLGIELVNGSNCSTAGDLICDTPAEPELLSLVDNNCNYIGTAKDPNGDVYKPKVDNVMSYSRCSEKFTPQQYQRMRYYYENTSKAITSCDLKADFSLSYKKPEFMVVKNTDKKYTLNLYNFSPKEYSGSITGLIQVTNFLGETVYTKNISIPSKLYPAYANDSINFLLNLPSSLTNGHYKLTTSLDLNNQIAESVENNNSSTITIYVTSTSSDVMDAALTIQGDAKNYVGLPYNFTFRVKNNGSTVLNNVSRDIYISKDHIISADDAKIPTSYVGGIKPGESYSSSESISLPTNINEKTFIIVVIDLLDYVKEVDETNNQQIIEVLKLTPSSTSAKLPDLSIQKVELVFADSAVFYNNNSDLLDITTSNLGDTTVAQYIMSHVYLSNDNILSNNDVLVGNIYDRFTRPWVSFRIPNNTPSGNYYLISVLDPLNYIKEKNETNNHHAFPIKVKNKDYADLILTDVKLKDSIWILNKTWNFTANIKNIGKLDEERYHIFAFLVDNPVIYISPFTHSIQTVENNVFYTEIPKGQSVPINYSKPVTSSYPLGYKYFAVCVIESGTELDDSLNSCYVHPRQILVTNNQAAGFEDASESRMPILVYPNPASDKIYIRTEEEFSYKLLDLNGMVLEAGKEKTIDVSKLSKGTYIIHFQTPSQNLVQKISLQ